MLFDATHIEPADEAARRERECADNAAVALEIIARAERLETEAAVLRRQAEHLMRNSS